ncbi:unnamed protein product, partial [Mesorhabditis spiculigera]
MILPILCLTDSGTFLWQQFKLPLIDYIPFFEEYIFLTVAISSAVSPVITIYYVQPYRRKIMEWIYFWQKGDNKLVYTTSNFKTMEITEGSKNSKFLQHARSAYYWCSGDDDHDKFNQITGDFDPIALRNLLAERRPESLHPDDFGVAIPIGHQNIYEFRVFILILGVTVPMFPSYAISLYYRRTILKKLHENVHMSKRTVEAQKSLLKALTIQLVIPCITMAESSSYLWKQFELPLCTQVPYFEEWIWLSMSTVRTFFGTMKLL